MPSVNSLPIQMGSYPVDEGDAADQMDFLKRISTVMNRQLGDKWNPGAALHICLCGMQSTGKSTILEYLLRADGVAFKRSNVGTKRPIVYTVRSSRNHTSTYEIQGRGGEYREVTKDGLYKELVKANKTFTAEEFRVRITTPSGFDVVLVDLPGFQAEPYGGSDRNGRVASAASHEAVETYESILAINKRHLSNNDALIVYMRNNLDWEADEDPGFKVVCDIDKSLRRTVIVTNWSETKFKQFTDTSSAEAFLTARGHRNTNVPSHVPLFFVDFELQDNPNGPPDRITKPIPSTNVQDFLADCQDRHCRALSQRYPELAKSYKKCFGTKLLGDYLRFVVLRNFRGVAEQASRVLMSQEARLKEAIASLEHGVNLNDARERYTLLLTEFMREVMEINVLPKNKEPFYVCLDDFEPWPCQESEDAVKDAIRSIIDKDGGRRAGGALYTEFVSTILPTAISAVRPQEITEDDKANFIGVVMGVARGDPLTSALIHAKRRAIELFDSTIEHILRQASFILSTVFHAAKELVHETMERMTPEKHRELLALYNDSEFLAIFLDCLDEAHHKFMIMAKDRTRKSLQDCVSRLCHPPPQKLPSRSLPIEKEGGRDAADGDDDSQSVDTARTYIFSDFKSPEEQVVDYIQYLEWWTRSEFAKAAVESVSSEMVDALIKPSHDDSFVMQLKRPDGRNGDNEALQLTLLQAQIDESRNMELDVKKAAYDEVVSVRKEIVRFLTKVPRPRSSQAFSRSDGEGWKRQWSRSNAAEMQPPSEQSWTEETKTDTSRESNGTVVEEIEDDADHVDDGSEGASPVQGTPRRESFLAGVVNRGYDGSPTADA